MAECGLLVGAQADVRDICYARASRVSSIDIMMTRIFHFRVHWRQIEPVRHMPMFRTGLCRLYELYCSKLR